MDLEKYEHFSFQDYLEDADFRSWVLQPTEENAQYWQKVLDAFPQQKEHTEKAAIILKEMEKFFRPEALKDRPIDEAFIQKLKQEASRHQAKPRFKVYLSRVAIAASILVLIGLSLWINNSMQADRMQIVTTQYGEWETIILPDGSSVELNANSQLQFAQKWVPGKDREVWLEGEAFFEVVKDATGAQFTVFTDDLAVEVLGTSFNVNSREAETEVFLEEGAVRLDLGADEQLMAPGELVVYSSEKQKITAYREASTERHTSWKDGSIILRDEPVEVIFEKLEEVFGYTIVTQDEQLLKSIKTIAIPMDQIDTAIPIIERTLDIKIIKQNDQLLIE